MKQQCDQHCETCPMQTQVHCAVVHSRAAYITVTSILERIENIEKSLNQDEHNLINPLCMGYTSDTDIEEQEIKEESEKLPAQEVGANK